MGENGNRIGTNQDRGNSVEEGEKEKKKGKREGKQTREKKKKSDRERERERERNKGGTFFRHFDCRSSTVREEKSIHATQAMRGYQNLGVSSNSVR